MDKIVFFITLVNIIISFVSIITELIKKYNSYQRYIKISKDFKKDINLVEDKINSEKFEIIFKNNSYNINTKKLEEKIYKENKNKHYIYQIMKQSCIFFAEMYNDKKIYCSIRVNNNKDFKTIAHFRCKDTSEIKEKIYFTEKNTDLANLTLNKYDRFIIGNIDDYKSKNSFTIQNIYLENKSKAIISIPIKDDNNILGCYTIYFSKPLDEKIKISNLKNLFVLLEEKLTYLLKEYLENSIDNTKFQNTYIIENSPSE